MTTTLTIGRTALELPPLAITGSRLTTTSDMWLPEGGITLPQFDPRYTYAPDSAYAAGRTLLAVVLDQGQLPCIVRVTGTTPALLADKQAELEAALSQIHPPVTLDIDGASRSWVGDFTWPIWDTPTPSTRADLTARAVFTIPINP